MTVVTLVIGAQSRLEPASVGRRRAWLVLFRLGDRPHSEGDFLVWGASRAQTDGSRRVLHRSAGAPDALLPLTLSSVGASFSSAWTASAWLYSGGQDIHSAPLVEVFARCLCTAQESIRNICGGEKATVSLRDVRRCIKVS